MPPGALCGGLGPAVHCMTFLLDPVLLPVQFLEGAHTQSQHCVVRSLLGFLSGSNPASLWDLGSYIEALPSIS